MACKADTGFAAPLFEMVQFGAFVVWVTNYVVTATQCVGPSMLPTIDTGGDVVLMLSMRLLRFFRLHRPRMGDVVISTSPTNPNQTICKRVLGVAGDTIPLRPGGIGHCDRYAIVVPAGHVWLQGDNVLDSTDSRVYGPVPLALLQGIVYAKLWPLSELGPIEEAPLSDLVPLCTDDASESKKKGYRGPALAVTVTQVRPSSVQEHFTVEGHVNKPASQIKNVVAELELQVLPHVRRDGEHLEDEDVLRAAADVEMGARRLRTMVEVEDLEARSKG